MRDCSMKDKVVKSDNWKHLKLPVIKEALHIRKAGSDPESSPTK